MVSESMKFYSMDGKETDIMRLIEESPKETILWDQPPENPQSRLAEKRANFMLNTYSSDHNNYKVSSSTPVDDSKKELVIYWKEQKCSLEKKINTVENKQEEAIIFENNNQIQFDAPLNLTTTQYSLKTENNNDNNNNTGYIYFVEQHPDALFSSDYNFENFKKQQLLFDQHVKPQQQQEEKLEQQQQQQKQQELEQYFKIKSTNLVRRNSSTDSGIIVRTPSERDEQRSRNNIDIKKLQLARSTTSDISTKKDEINGKTQRRRRSHSLPNLRDMELYNSEEIDILRTTKKMNLLSSVSFSSRIKNQNLFSITDYMHGKQRKHKKEKKIPRSSTFSVGNNNKSCVFEEFHFEDDFTVIPKKEKKVEDDEENIILTFDVNSTDNHGDSCLHHASSKGDINTIQYLLKHGGNVWLKNEKDCLPLDLSTNFQTAKLLSQATIFYTDNTRHTTDNNISSTVKLAFDL